MWCVCIVLYVCSVVVVFVLQVLYYVVVGMVRCVVYISIVVRYSGYLCVCVVCC